MGQSQGGRQRPQWSKTCLSLHTVLWPLPTLSSPGIQGEGLRAPQRERGKPRPDAGPASEPRGRGPGSSCWSETPCEKCGLAWGKPKAPSSQSLAFFT